MGRVVIFVVCVFCLSAHAGECPLTLQAREARGQILEARQTAELLGLCLRQSPSQIDKTLSALAHVESLDPDEAQRLFDRVEDACRLQVRVMRVNGSLNVRARETLAFDEWSYL